MNDSLQEELTRWLQTIGVRLDRAQWEHIELYLREVEDYNRKTNLTADSGETLWIRHVADGLAAVPLLRRLLPPPSSRPRILDLGAGAGFIGISVKIARPEAAVTLMESSRKKFEFLNWAAARLGLPGLRVEWRRAASGVPDESPSAGFDAVLARALAPLPEAVRTAAPLLAEGGAFISYQTQPIAEAAAIREPFGEAGVELAEVVPYRLPREGSPRHLAVFRRRA